jgi:ABC-type multidrug transport system ATPase subunit
MMATLTIDNLTKRHSADFQLGPLSLTLSPGDTLGVIGKNGAGKSTLFQLLTGSMDASSGTAKLDQDMIGVKAFHTKRRMGYLPQAEFLPRWVTGHELMRYAAHLLNVQPKTMEEAMVYWDCDSYSDQPIAAYSHGMQKRLGLALAHQHEPDVVILDEPFEGLDIFHTRALFDAIAKRTKRGQITVLSTHVAPYLSRACNRLLFLDSGTPTEMTDWARLDEQKRTALIEHLFFPQGGTPDV